MIHVALSPFDLAPLAGRGIGRLWRPFLNTPKRSFGYGVAPGEGDSPRVRLSPYTRRQPLTPALSPQERGEGADRELRRH
jgi:hypothetical protein